MGQWLQDSNEKTRGEEDSADQRRAAGEGGKAVPGYRRSGMDSARDRQASSGRNHDGRVEGGSGQNPEEEGVQSRQDLSGGHEDHRRVPWRHTAGGVQRLFSSGRPISRRREKDSTGANRETRQVSRAWGVQTDLPVGYRGQNPRAPSEGRARGEGGDIRQTVRIPCLVQQASQARGSVRNGPLPLEAA